MARSDDLQKWRKQIGMKDIFLHRQNHLRTCKLCGNRYPLTGDFFMRQNKHDIPGMIKGGLLFVCKVCQTFWVNGDHEARNNDIRHMAALVEKAGPLANQKARSFIDVYGDKGGK